MFTTGPEYSCLPLIAYQIMANMIVTPNIKLDQFILVAVTGLARGQNSKKKRGARKQSEAILIARPYLPSDHRRGGRGGPFSRLQTRLPMVMM